MPRVCYYVRGRQIRRVHNEYAKLFNSLDERDWYWINEICCAKVPRLDEERYPIKWTRDKKSRYSALRLWRKHMAKKHPYPFPYPYPHPYEVTEKKDTSLCRHQKKTTPSHNGAVKKGTSCRRRQKNATRKRRNYNGQIGIKRNWNEDEADTTNLNQDADYQMNYSSSSEPEGVDYGVSDSE